MSVLFTNALILPCTTGMPVIDRGWLRVEGERIAALGPGNPPDAAGAIDLGGDVLMPGMVNPHSHLAMSLFRGLGEDVDDRLYRYILPLEREFVTPEMVRAGTALSALELIRGGVTTVADMYYFETVVAEVLDGAGLHPIYDIYAALVFSAMAPDVADVMVAGRWLMQDGVVQTMEPARVMADAAQVAGRFRGRMAEIDRALRAVGPGGFTPPDPRGIFGNR